jgi:hypothetical protein
VHKTSSIKLASSKDVDNDTDISFLEPAIDNSNGLLTSYTNAFNKKEAVITNSVGLDGEL